MAIVLVTGQPGHGKTQYALQRGLEFVAEGRAVYAGNVRGMRHDLAGFKPLDDFKEWESLPDNSVVLWDECYDAIPQRASGRPVPAHIEALARHRHRGFDFILVCQQPMQLDGFVFGLIERHLHVRRKFGTQFLRIKVWDRAERQPEKAKQLVTQTVKLNPKVYPLYESATQHTVKRHVPWYFVALPIGLAFLAFCMWAVPTMFVERAREIEAQGAGRTAALADGRPATGAKGSTIKGDYIAAMRPRVEGLPWTAPAFAEREVKAEPEIFCISSESSCTCLTEQGTRVRVQASVCRHIARYGVYNPFREPVREAKIPASSPAKPDSRKSKEGWAGKGSEGGLPEGTATSVAAGVQSEAAHLDRIQGGIW